MNENAGVTIGWIEMEMIDAKFRDALRVMMHQGKQAESRQQNDGALGSFEHGHHLYPARDSHGRDCTSGRRVIRVNRTRRFGGQFANTGLDFFSKMRGRNVGIDGMGAV